ncbi:MAG TPA: response regulator [Methanoregulaceae archaeon]|nr:response regulator [Methanoregulaceae archaeon]
MISILLIEDDAALLELTRDYLGRSGTVTADTAQSAEDALIKIGRRSYDAVISDYLLPDMDGITLLKRLRASDNYVPFIIFTGRSREQVVIEALNNGADFFLQKGGDPKTHFAELENMIMQAISRRKAEEGLRESIRRLNDIINFLPDATFAVDREGRVVAWNRAMEALTGIPPQDMLGKEDQEYSLAFYHERRPHLIDLIFAPPEEIALWGYTSIKKKGAAIEAETVLARQGAEILSLWITAAPLFDEHGAVAGAIESVRDITGYKIAEDSGRRSESRFRGLFEHSPLAVAIFDEKGDFVEMNRTCRSLLGPGTGVLWKDFNLFRGRIIPPSAQGALAKGESFRFSVAPDLAYADAGAVFSSLNLDIMVIPLRSGRNLPVSGFIMQFGEIHGACGTVQTQVS